MAYETIAVYGDRIPTVRNNESVQVRILDTPKGPQVEITTIWANDAKGTEGIVFATHFGKSRAVGVNLSDIQAIDDLIAGLEAAKIDYAKLGAPVAKATEVTAPKPLFDGAAAKPVKPRGAAVTKRAVAKKRASTRKAS